MEAPGLCVPGDPVGEQPPLVLPKLGVLGEGVDQRRLLAHEGLRLVHLRDNLDHLADDDTVDHSPRHHDHADVDDLARGDRANVPEADGREDREHEVEGVDPLLEGVLLQKGLHNVQVGVDVAPEDPGVLGVFVQRGAQVPAARQEVRDPEQAHGVVHDPHAPEALEPAPDAARGPKARELHQPHEARQHPSQARDALQPPDSQGLVAVEPAIDLAA
mmetsp:Transcript_75471/g.197854  ORF Transcript_75471/g.197854 Transcript_75471/m.197854 type:complete len:217 (+) Transcript_75471:698-1348(+)